METTLTDMYTLRTVSGSLTSYKGMERDRGGKLKMEVWREDRAVGWMYRRREVERERRRERWSRKPNGRDISRNRERKGG